MSHARPRERRPGVLHHADRHRREHLLPRRPVTFLTPLKGPPTLSDKRLPAAGARNPWIAASLPSPCTLFGRDPEEVDALHHGLPDLLQDRDAADERAREIQVVRQCGAGVEPLQPGEWGGVEEPIEAVAKSVEHRALCLSRLARELCLRSEEHTS